MSTAIHHYLAMTASEFGACEQFPAKIGWMACHFSPYSTGLCNLPSALPEGSLLILNDRTPIHRHDPERIRKTLEDLTSSFGCRGVLLDFETGGSPEAAALSRYLAEMLSCPVILSKSYAVEGAPVFLPPVPLDMPLSQYLGPWQGREIWLDTALDALEIRLTEAGAARIPVPWEAPMDPDRTDTRLQCRYRVALEKDCARFTLYRTRETVEAMLQEAASYGVTAAVGLYQEWSTCAKSPPCTREADRGQ